MRKSNLRDPVSNQQMNYTVSEKHHFQSREKVKIWNY